MRKIFFLLALVLLAPTQAFSWDATAGAGYHHRHYSSDDQIGAVSPAESLHPVSSSGISLVGSWSLPIWSFVTLGPEVGFEYGWLQLPQRTGYYTKTAGIIDTLDIRTQSVTLAIKTQVFENKNYHIFLKPGFLIHRISSEISTGIDVDTGGFVGAEFDSDLGENYRIFFNMQAIFSPTVRGAREYDLSYGLVFGIQRVFRNKLDPSVLESVKPENAKPPEPLKIEPSKLPEPVTPVVLPEPVTPQSSPSQQEKATKPMKAVLKLGPDGRLSQESYPLIQKILDAYKKSTKINVQYRSGEKELAEEIKSWLVLRGCDKEDVVLELVEKLDKPLRINITQK